MTELKVGDRVKVEFEAIVKYIGLAGDALDLETQFPDAPLLHGRVLSVPISAVTKIDPPKPKLPTTIGSVVRCTQWAGRPVDYTVLLKVDGWWFSVDEDCSYNAWYLDTYAGFAWEPLYAPAESQVDNYGMGWAAND